MFGITVRPGTSLRRVLTIENDHRCATAHFPWSPALAFRPGLSMTTFLGRRVGLYYIEPLIPSTTDPLQSRAGRPRLPAVVRPGSWNSQVNDGGARGQCSGARGQSSERGGKSPERGGVARRERGDALELGNLAINRMGQLGIGCLMGCGRSKTRVAIPSFLEIQERVTVQGVAEL